MDETTAGSAQSTQPEPESVLPIGELIAGRYEILSHLGTGGMGEVYKVRDKETDKVYALKMISKQLANQKMLAKRLEHEAAAARTLAHGNIVSVYEVGNSFDGSPYMLMDYVEGESLDHVLKEEAFVPYERAISLFMQVAEALVHARQKGIIHRDLKPSNIILSKTENGVDIIKIVDFGIAKISDHENQDKTKLTQTGELLGTPLYMSPEQCRGDEIDPRSDIYSFGCIMYEVLTGKSPFAAENPVKVILKHLAEAPPAIPNNIKMPSDMKKVISRCLEKDPADRYPTAVELHIDLERVHDGRPTVPYRRKVHISKKQRATAAAAASLLIGAGVAAWFGFHNVATTPVAQETATPNRPETYYGKTLSQWSAAIEKSPDDPELYYNRGMLHDLRDERTNAIDDYTQALSLKPDYIAALSHRAFVYAMIEQAAKAEQDANKIISLAPDDATGYETRSMVNQVREQYVAAVRDAKRAAALNDSPYYHYMIANCLMKLSDFKEAQNEITKAIRMSENQYTSPTYWGVSGALSTLSQDFPAALKALEVSTKQSDARGVEWGFLAFYYVSTKNMPEAERTITRMKAVETFPARSYRFAGEIYRTAGLYDKSMREFSASTSLEQYPPGYREMAQVAIALGEWRTAYTDLKKSLQMNSQSAATMSYLAVVEDHLGMKADATKHITAALAVESRLPPLVYVNHATILLNQGDTKQALAEANRAISIDPYLKEGYQIRSDIEKKLGDTAKAAADSEKASKLVPQLDI